MFKIQIIGRKDKVDFPKWGIENIRAKVDTGAYTSSIHCDKVELSDDGQTLTALIGVEGKMAEVTFSDFKKKMIKSSTGISSARFIIKTTIRIFEEDFPIELSLSQRNSMKNPVLLGRQLLNNRFVVDTKKANLSFKHKNTIG